MPDPIELKAIEERVAKATPGPWKRDQCDSPRMQVVAHGNEVVIFHRDHERQVDSRVVANHEFCAAARTDIPTLCREVRELRAALLRYGDHSGECFRYRYTHGTHFCVCHWTELKRRLENDNGFC